MPVIELTYKQHQEFVVTIPVNVEVEDDEHIESIVEALDGSDDWYTKVVMPTMKKEITEAFDDPYAGWVDLTGSRLRNMFRRTEMLSGNCYELVADVVENIDEFLGDEYTQEILRLKKVEDLEYAMECCDYAAVAKLAAELNAGIYE